jgi:hypothetical protein
MNRLFKPQQSPTIQRPPGPKFRLACVLDSTRTGERALLGVILLARLGIAKEPNPNPIGVGLLAFLTFWPSVLLVMIGVATAFFCLLP